MSDLRPDEFPHVRKVGRYGFYAILAFSTAVMAGVAARLAGVKPESILERGIVIMIMLSVFMVLRDSEKNAEQRGRGHPQ
jgi:hypothetical protein